MTYEEWVWVWVCVWLLKDNETRGMKKNRERHQQVIRFLRPLALIVARWEK